MDQSFGSFSWFTETDKWSPAVTLQDSRSPRCRAQIFSLGTAAPRSFCDLPYWVHRIVFDSFVVSQTSPSLHFRPTELLAIHRAFAYWRFLKCLKTILGGCLFFFNSRPGKLCFYGLDPTEFFGSHLIRVELEPQVFGPFLLPST